MSKQKNTPEFRINFCPVIQDGGKSKLGRGVAIGAAWPTKSGEGYRLKFDIVPQNIHEGVVFLDPVQSQDQKQDSEMELEP